MLTELPSLSISLILRKHAYSKKKKKKKKNLKISPPKTENFQLKNQYSDQPVHSHSLIRIITGCIVSSCGQRDTLRKHSYSNILNILLQRKENFQIKHSDIFHISAQKIDCMYSLELPRRGGYNENPQFMILSRNKKNNVYPCKPQFYYIKVGFKGVNIR